MFQSPWNSFRWSRASIHRRVVSLIKFGFDPKPGLGSRAPNDFSKLVAACRANSVYVAEQAVLNLVPVPGGGTWTHTRLIGELVGASRRVHDTRCYRPHMMNKSLDAFPNSYSTTVVARPQQTSSFRAPYYTGCRKSTTVLTRE